MSGYVVCSQGHRHWGIHGAAGILIHRYRSSGEVEMLLQLRGLSISDPNSWSIPGGAIEENETAEIAALRETEEELGFNPREFLEPGVSMEDDHGGWMYTTIPARLIQELDINTQVKLDHESQAVSWFTCAELKTLNLHPGFEGFIRKYLTPLTPPPPDINPSTGLIIGTLNDDSELEEASPQFSVNEE
ncbi:hypothetical protein AAE478_001051 [Parahypoxylon ruwenzoriense]